MFHRLALVVAALAAVSTAGPAPAAFEDAIARLEPGIVLVQVAVEDPEDGSSISTGTGFVIDAGGYIVTNEHIIANNTEAPEVIVRNRHPYRATVVVRDPDHDIAILRIDAPDLQPVPLGDSDAVRTGAAIGVGGYPLAERLQEGGFELTASFNEGRINAIRVGRSDVSGERMSFFEFDARVNPGNSGGPLFLRDTGEVIGVVVAKLAPQTGISFAIPINLAVSLWRGPRFQAQAREPNPPAGAVLEGGLYRDAALGFQLRVPKDFKSIAPRDGLSAQFDALQGHCSLFVKSAFAAQPLDQCAGSMESDLGLQVTDTKAADLAGRRALERRYVQGDLEGKARLCVADGRFYAVGYLAPAAEAPAWDGAFDEALSEFALLEVGTQPEDGQEYVNEAFRFRVRAPKGWKIQQPGERALRVGVVSPDGRCTVAFGAELLAAKTSPEAYAESARASFSGTLTAEQQARLGGQRAVERIYRHTDAEGQWRLRVIAATRESTGYLAIACAREPDYERHAAEIDELLKSFEVLPREKAQPAEPTEFLIKRAVAASSARGGEDEAPVFASDIPAVYCVFDYVAAPPNTHVAVRWYFDGKYQRRLSRNLVVPPGDGRATFMLKRAEDEQFAVGSWRAELVGRGEVVGSAAFRIR